MLHAARDYLASLSPPIATVGKTLNQDLALETTWYKDYFTKTGDLK
jgi:hypothetical protein